MARSGYAAVFPSVAGAFRILGGNSWGDTGTTHPASLCRPKPRFPRLPSRNSSRRYSGRSLPIAIASIQQTHVLEGQGEVGDVVDLVGRHSLHDCRSDSRGAANLH